MTLNCTARGDDNRSRSAGGGGGSFFEIGSAGNDGVASEMASSLQQLDPANVRLRNDCALIAIYHLERDWDLVKGLLDAAIKDGDDTLQNDPPDNEAQRQQLAEAVGDGRGDAKRVAG